MSTHHQCACCPHLLCEECSEILKFLPELESSLPTDTKMFLVYIAGSVSHKDPEQRENRLLEHTTFCYQNMAISQTPLIGKDTIYH